jgi:hypothetical protein
VKKERKRKTNKKVVKTYPQYSIMTIYKTSITKVPMMLYACFNAEPLAARGDECFFWSINSETNRRIAKNEKNDTNTNG